MGSEDPGAAAPADRGCRDRYRRALFGVEVRTSQQVLAAGGMISRTEQTNIYRDSQGRVERKVPGQGEVSASLRNGAVRFANRSGSGSVSHVFREQGIHIVADTVAEVVADDAYSIQPGD